jgi:lipopolysaccharide biosynthesis glycosyltransferase
MHLFYCANRSYLFPMAVSLHSALLCVRTPVTATLAVEGADSGLQDALRTLFPSPSVRIRKLPAGRADAKYPFAMFARLLVEKLIPPDATTVLYIDSDTVIYDDVNRLKHSIECGKIISAVRDDYAIWKYDWPASFNSGVVCIDVPSWRAANVGSAALALVVKEGMSDQQALNTVLADHWTPLDPRWNVMTHFYTPNARWEYAPAACKDAAIRHFTAHKPWLSRPNDPVASSFHVAAAALRETNDEAWRALRDEAVG